RGHARSTSLATFAATSPWYSRARSEPPAATPSPHDNDPRSARFGGSSFRKVIPPSSLDRFGPIAQRLERPHARVPDEPVKAEMQVRSIVEPTEEVVQHPGPTAAGPGADNPEFRRGGENAHDSYANTPSPMGDGRPHRASGTPGDRHRDGRGGAPRRREVVAVRHVDVEALLARVPEIPGRVLDVGAPAQGHHGKKLPVRAPASPRPVPRRPLPPRHLLAGRRSHLVRRQRE